MDEPRNIKMTSVTFDEEMEKNNPNLKESDVEMLKSWHKSRHDLPLITDSDYSLFLNSSSYDMMKARNNIHCYFTSRTYMPQFFKGRDIEIDEDMRQATEVLQIFPLMEKSHDDYHVILACLQCTKHIISYVTAIKYFTLVVDHLTYEVGSSKGTIFVVDISDISNCKFSALKAKRLKNLVRYFKVAPINWKGLHLVDFKGTVQPEVLNFFNKRIVRKYPDLIFLHSDYKTIETIAPLSIFPRDLINEGRADTLANLHQEEMDTLQYNMEWIWQMDSVAILDFKIVGFNHERIFTGLGLVYRAL